MEHEYYPAHITAVPAGRNAFFVKNHNSGKMEILPALQTRMFMSLTGCGTLEFHAGVLQQINPYEISGSAFESLLKEWAGKGLLRPRSRLSALNRFPADTPIPLKTGIITCNRPGALKKCLESRISSGDYVRRRLPVLVCDDSSEPEIIRRNREIIAYCRSRYPGNIAYAGRNEKRNYIENIAHISNGKISGDIFSFAFAETDSFREISTAGANMNFMTLSTAGSFLYKSDDDIYYSFARAETAQAEGVDFVSDFHSPVKFYPGKASLEDSLERNIPFDLPGEILTHLSVGSPTFFGPASARDSMENLSPLMAFHMETGGARIKAVTAGHYGGSWHDDASLFLRQRDRTAEDYYSVQEMYSTLRKMEHNSVLPERKTAAAGHFLQGGTLGLDAAEMVPPFFPVGRYEDACFGILLKQVYPHGYYLHLPAAAFHYPEGKKTFTAEQYQMASAGTGKFVSFFLRSFTSSLRSSDAAVRLAETGIRFEELGAVSTGTFEENLRERHHGLVSGTLRHMEFLLDHHDGSPRWWAEDVTRYIEVLEKELENPHSTVPREFRNPPGGMKAGWTKEEALTLFQSWLRMYGLLLQHWPEIWEAARGLNEEGRGLYSP